MMEHFTEAHLVRFWSMTEWKDGHLLWTGYIRPNGYGAYVFRRRPERVHRVALTIYLRREIAPGKHALHTRDCTKRHCICFEHLYEGTRSDNMQDMFAMGRQNTRQSRGPNWRPNHWRVAP
jgi:hypothetical protein